MTLTLEIPPEIQRELAREARTRGLAVSALAVRLLAEAISRSGGPRANNRNRLAILTARSGMKSVPQAFRC